MKITEKELGAILLALCAFFGMVSPMAARWILAVLCLSGILSLWKEK